MRFLILVVLYLGSSCGNSNFDGQIVTINAGLTDTVGSHFNKEIIGPIDENDRSSTKKKVAKQAERYGNALEDVEEEVTNEENFVYPCDLEDLDCIREFLSENSNCKKKYGPVEDPLYLLQTTILYTSINVTATLTDVELGGFADAEIKEFYYNTVTDNLVFAFNIPALTAKSPKAFLSFQRPGRESIVQSDYARGVYENLIITAILKKLPKLRLETAEINAYLSDSNPEFEVGPNIFKSTDPTVVEAQQAFEDCLDVLFKENFVTQSQIFMVNYIQTLLCDFDVELYSL